MKEKLKPCPCGSEVEFISNLKKKKDCADSKKEKGLE